MAAPAQAVYIETPLDLEASETSCDVGDDVAFTIGPNPDNTTYRERWAGKTVAVGYTFDRNEGTAEDPDEPTSDAGQTEGRILDGLTLDGEARGTFTWTIPAELDAYNVLVFLEGPDGERLASIHLAVGNATPVMYTTGISDGREIDEGGADGGGANDDLSEDGRSEDGRSEDAEASAIGTAGLVTLGAIAAVALAGVRMRRS